MNRIYKVIWNKTRGMYMVVSELAKGQSKDGRRAVGRKKVAQTAAALAVFFSIVSMGGTSFAADTTTVTDTEGKTQTVYTKDGVDSGIESLQEGIQKFSEQVQESLQKSQESIDEEAKKRKFSVTNLENADTAETAAREAADTEIKQAMTDQKTSTALHVTQAGNLIVGTKENQIVKNLKINGQLTAGSLSTGDIVSSGDVTVTGKMAADGVTDETTKDGTYIKQNNTVGNNLVSLDTQVKSNADAIEEEARKRKYSVTNLENADKQLQTNIDNEAAAREAADTALDTRITNVKEYLQQEVADTYVSKDDAAVQDGAIVKAANTIGDNVTKLDAALAKETADRLGADAAQDKVIQQVNDNLVASVNTINESVKTTNENMAAGFTALSQADANEAATREAADTEIKQAMTDQKTSTALHISSTGDLIVGTKENQTVKDMKIRGELTSGSLSTGDITSSGNVSVAGKVEAEAVYDDTTKTGNYVVQTNSVGANLSALDTQVKSNADAIEEEARKRKYSVTNLENADKQLQTNIDNEAATREAKDNELNERITNEANAIHETTNQLQSDLNTETAARKAADAALDSRTTALEDKTEAITYDKDSKTVMVDGKLTATEGITDGTTQDGQYVKGDNYVGQNLNALDQGLQAETTARQAADTTLQTNIDNEAAERKAADTVLDDKITAETSARVAADTKLVEAVNSGLSLSDDNVLQKNTTTIDAQGNVTTSKTDANEMILNKGKDNQITLNENGIKVGTNSSVMDANGVYTGGDTYSEAKAAMSADGSIKGADGKFTVNSANGTVNVNDQIELNGATGVVKSNGLNVGDGNFKVNSSGGVTAAGGKTTLASDGSIKAADGKFTVNSNGGVKAADGKITLSSDGSVKAADGKFTVNSDGGVKAADGKITLSSDGSLKAADGKFTVDSNGAVKAANGNTTIDSNGNLSTMGTVSAANGKFTVDTNGAITSTGLDAGNGTIQTTGTVKAGDVQTGTLETTGDATIGGNLTVDKNLTVNGEFNAKTLSSKLDENNYTTITGGKTQSVNLKMDTATGETKASASTFDETGSNLWAKDDDSIGKSTVTADGISQKLSDTGDNPTAYAESAMSQGTDNKYTMTDTVKDGDKTNVASQSATESSDVITEGSGDSAKTSTFRQKIDQILQEIKSANGSTSVEQTDVNITNTAKNGTITNEAQTLVNKATGDMTNTVGGKMLNDVTGDMENKVGGNLTTTVGGNETHTVGGTLTETVTGKATENYNGGLETTITGEEKHTVNGDQTNTITGKQTTTVTGDVTEDYKANLSTTVGGNQTTTVTGDSSLTAENITNEAKNKITNKALDVETDASSSIVSKVSNEYGSNTSTQLSYQTTEEMSQADGKKASYLRGAAEEKSQLTDGDKKTTVDTIAGQTNTNITDGTNTSNSLQKADQVASSVTDGTNTTVVNQDATSLASSITDGTKANNTNSTVDKSEQLIKASDTQYSATTKTATKTEDALVSGSSVIDVIKSLDDAGSPTISSAVTDGTNSTGITQTAKDITNTAKNGTIANDAKDIINNAAENMTNTVGKDLTTTVGGEMKTTVTGKTTENYNGGLETTITGEEKHTVNGDQINNITGDQTNTIGGSQTTTVTGDSSLSAQNITNTASETLSNSAKNITNTAAEKLSNSAAEIENTASKSITDKVGDNVSRTMTTSQIKESVVDGANSNTSTKTASKDMNIVTDGTSTSTLSQLAGSVNTSLKEVDSSGNSVKSLNNVQTVSEDTTKITDTATGDFSSRSQKANGFTSQVKNNSGGSNTVTDTATTSEQKLVSGNIIDILKDAETGYVNTTVSSGTGDDATSTSVKQGTADITNTAKQGTITNEAKNLVNKAEEKLSNSAAEIENTATTSIKDVVGKSTVTTTDTGTTFENTDHAAAIGEGSITQTTISGNTLETGKATADYVDVNKDLHVMGNTQLDGTLEVGGKSTFKDDVTMEKNLDVKGTTTTDKLVVNNGANITGGTTTDTLHVTSTATFDGMVTFKDAVSMEKDLTVGGSATVAGDVTAKSYKVGDKTYIDENGINANGQKITNVADGTVAEGSTDAVNGGQLNATNQRVTTVENRMDGVENRMDRVENRVDNLDNRIDKVGASAAAMANLHPMDFDEDSKVSVAAAMGSYRSETAGALGVFYRPTDRVMLNVSTSFGNGENMVGGGVSFKLGKSSKRLEKAEATNATLAKQVTNLQNRLDALLGVLNPSLSKDFPDVPANHWAYEAVSRLAGNNIVQGYEDGKYHGERTMTRYEMAEIIYNALSKGAKAEAKLVEEFRPELQAMAAQRKA
ncbi:ESPR-type extended signal peptide-containing protein [Acidaminococcus massiliensis]|uniref:ESPR-type extended signal peptide-containing protein n=1 Tax=Acidaminococcus massiliensis TaxID=1852375 RepID=UPI00266C3479|nr:ESPR-type extended signal peptide-containing protein [Acidaminococcus massiliensis]